jgi:hypothetical protein
VEPKVNFQKNVCRKILVLRSILWFLNSFAEKNCNFVSNPCHLGRKNQNICLEENAQFFAENWLKQSEIDEKRRKATKSGKNRQKSSKIGKNRSTKIDENQTKISENRRKSPKIAENRRKSPKIAENRRKSPKIAENRDPIIAPE